MKSKVVGALAILSSVIFVSAFGERTFEEWTLVGTTSAACEFSASFYKLGEYPFAKLVIHGAQEKIVPMLMVSKEQCEEVEFEMVAVDTIQFPPIYSVKEEKLCQSSLPIVTVTKRLSGIQFSCEL